jgi:predicted transcriptional regulator
VLLREPALNALHEWIERHAGAAQREILDAMLAQGWSRSTTQHRLQRLVAGGAVELGNQGRRRTYRLRPAAPSAAAAGPPIGPVRP